MLPEIEKPSDQHLFDQECQAHGIEHRLIKPGKRHGEALQRPHQRRIGNSAHTLGKDLEQTLKRYAWLYNHHIPQKTLHHRSPIAAMKECQVKRPELFTKRVINHARPDCYFSYHCCP